MEARGRKRGPHGAGRTAAKKLKRAKAAKARAEAEAGGSRPADDRDGGAGRHAFKDFVYENRAFEEYYRVNQLLGAGRDHSPPADLGAVADAQAAGQAAVMSSSASAPGPSGRGTEWGELMATLRTPLPITWRVNLTTPLSSHVIERLSPSQCFGLYSGDLQHEGQPLSRPRAIPWYPGGQAFEFDVSRRGIRMVSRENPAVMALREYLIAQDREGIINKQEAVSMIPTLLLAADRHHSVLDMCASPGSKTSQLLSDVHSYRHGAGPAGGAEAPTGFVVANDMDTKRAYMLAHQMQRLCSPGYMVSVHDARAFPTLYRQVGAEEAAGALRAAAPAGAAEPTAAQVAAARVALQRPLLFDRVLCDVPCSGDGTMRKNLELWARWNPRMGLDIHPLQVQIAQRGMQLLAEGGDMVYSTCSFNPVENEAVVAELVRLSAGALEVVDVSDRLPGLLREPGMLRWRVKSGDAWLDSMPEVAPGGDPPAGLRPSVFPPPTEEEARALGLHRCVRILPHRQNTGGFFIALLRKRAPVAADVRLARQLARMRRTAAFVMAGGEEAARYVAEHGRAPPRPAGVVGVDAAGGEGEGEDGEGENGEEEDGKGAGAHAAGDDARAAPAPGRPLVVSAPREKRTLAQASHHAYAPMGESERASVCSFFGLPVSLPEGELAFRAEGNERRVYLLSRDLASTVLFRGNGRLKCVAGGVRVLDAVRDGRQSDCRFRVTQEGIHSLLPHMTRQLMHVTMDEMALLLGSESFAFRALPRPLLDKLTPMLQGSFVAALSGASFSHPVAAVMWKAPGSLVSMVPKQERVVLLDLLSEASGKDYRAAAAAAAAAAAKSPAASKSPAAPAAAPAGAET